MLPPSHQEPLSEAGPSTSAGASTIILHSSSEDWSSESTDEEIEMWSESDNKVETDETQDDESENELS